MSSGDDESPAMPLIEPGSVVLNEKPRLSIPGRNAHSIAMLPLRLVLWAAAFVPLYLLLLPIAWLRALYLRIVKGRPSQILAQGGHPLQNHSPGGMNYNSQLLFDRPFDEKKLRAALVSTAGEDNIAEHEVELDMIDEEPQDWSPTAAFTMHYYLPKSIPVGSSPMFYMMKNVGKTAKVSWKVFNGKPGKPTVLLYSGSGNGWDGSSNYNFMREVIQRYCGRKETKVFAYPTIDPESAKLFDRGSFLYYLLRQPYNLARALGGSLWVVIRAAKWSGGNGIGPKITALNFNVEESLQLYKGCKALGATPFAAFTHAAVKACREVLHESPSVILQQASLQTRHYPLPGQGDDRDLVGDWLVAPVQYVARDYSLAAAQRGADELRAELNDVGPRTLRSFMAKAYGLINSGAAGFEIIPGTFNDDVHPLSKAIFMNNYGVRTVAPESGCLAWNWNAPMWFGVNTINVNGRTTTLFGSSLWGLPLVEAMRDNIEATLREIMTHAADEKAGVKAVPAHSAERHARSAAKKSE